MVVPLEYCAHTYTYVVGCTWSTVEGHGQGSEASCPTQTTNDLNAVPINNNNIFAKIGYPECPDKCTICTERC